MFFHFMPLIHTAKKFMYVVLIVCAYPRNQQIHCSNCLPIIILPHIESLDFLQKLKREILMYASLFQDQLNTEKCTMQTFG